MKSEFTLAFNEIADRSKLSREVILEALESAMVSAYRKAVNASSAQLVQANVDPEDGKVRVYAEKEVVEETHDDRTEVTLDEARKVEPDAALGDMVVVECTPRDFGRIAAQTAKQVILQRLREAEREAQYQEYVEREGDIVNGTVQSVTGQAVTVSLGRAEAILPRNQQVAGERYRPHRKIRAYVLEVRKTPRGPQIVVSRTHKNMLRRLLEYEVPEIYNGLVEIKSIAREAGRRSKVAVAAMQEGVDPVGACVGMRGVRIQSIVRELNDEKIDIIEWKPDQATFISKALSPARVSGVYLNSDPDDGRTALVVVPDDQLSLAIGREGQNARLAAKLTGWRIDIKSLTEAAQDVLIRLREDPDYAEMATALAEETRQMELTLARRAENRPAAPEEFRLLADLVDQVERRGVALREAILEERAQQMAEIRAAIPAPAYDFPLAESGLSTRVLRLLEGAGYQTAGDVLEQLAIDDDEILALQNFGPKALEETRTVLASLTYPEPEPEVLVEEAAEVAGPADEVEAPGEAPAPEDVEVAPAVEVEVAADAEAPAAAEAAVSAPAEGIEEPEPELAAEEALAAEEGLPVEEGEGEEELVLATAGKKKKKKKKSRRQKIILEYDPDLDMVVTRRRRKRGGDEVDSWEDGKY